MICAAPSGNWAASEISPIENMASTASSRCPTSTRLLPNDTKIANKDRLTGIRQVVNLRHSVGSPLRVARDQISDACVALPKILMRAFQAFSNGGKKRGLGGCCDVPYFMGLVAKRAQHVKLIFIGFGQCRSWADPDHLCTTLFGFALFARDVCQILGVLGVGHVDDGGAIVFNLVSQGIEFFVAVVPHVSNPLIALFLDRGLVSRSGLKVAVTHQFHVH